jgi:outer membrane protein
MKKTIILLVTLVALCSFVFSEVKIGVIDAQQIIEKTKKGLEIQKRLEDWQKQKRSEMQKMQESIEKLRKELQSPALNNETREKKALELQTKQKEFKRYYEDAENEFRRRSGKEIMALEKELMPMIENLGKAKGFTIIFDISRPGIAYFDKAVDITPEIIKAVDAKYSK